MQQHLNRAARDAYGPVMVLCCWAKGYQEPLYLVSNMEAAEEACRYYQKRFRIETCFEDGKQYLGMGDDEVRSWRGWHRHMTLCILAHFFLVRACLRLKKKPLA